MHPETWSHRPPACRQPASWRHQNLAATAAQLLSPSVPRLLSPRLVNPAGPVDLKCNPAPTPPSVLLQISLTALPLTAPTPTDGAGRTILLKARGLGRRGHDLYQTTFSDYATSSFPATAVSGGGYRVVDRMWGVAAGCPRWTSALSSRPRRQAPATPPAPPQPVPGALRCRLTPPSREPSAPPSASASCWMAPQQWQGKAAARVPGS